MQEIITRSIVAKNPHIEPVYPVNIDLVDNLSK